MKSLLKKKPFGLFSLVLLCSVSFFGLNVQAETTFEKIKRTGKVTVGTEAAFPPFEFVEDGNNGFLLEKTSAKNILSKIMIML